jgi:hypothetical protein
VLLWFLKFLKQPWGEGPLSLVASFFKELLRVRPTLQERPSFGEAATPLERLAPEGGGQNRTLFEGFRKALLQEGSTLSSR